MAQFRQSVASDSFNPLVPGVGSEMNVASALPVPIVEEAVSLALGPEGRGEVSGVSAGSSAADTTVAFPNAAGESAGSAGSAPVVDFPPRLKSAPPRAVLHALQEWEGYVVELGSSEFVARLVDLTAGSSHEEEEEAIIPLEEVSESDAAKMAVGSIFRWVIGYERSLAGTKRRVSEIWFRDMPRITERDLQEGKEWARETLRAFKL